jgi:hypothetical protein
MRRNRELVSAGGSVTPLIAQVLRANAPQTSTFAAILRATAPRRPLTLLDRRRVWVVGYVPALGRSLRDPLSA